MQTNPGLMTSKVWQPAMNFGGLFDSDPRLNPDWSDASYIYFPYCTSDSFSGTRDASNQTFGWHFRGKKVITYVIQSLLSQGLGNAPQVLVSGCSAGGVAVLANLDYVASLLPKMTRNIRGHNDAGWMLDARPMTAVPITITQIIQQGVQLWGGSPDQSCVASHPSEIWKCYMGQYVIPYITIPLLVHQETEDFVQLQVAGCSKPFNTQKQQYLNEFRVNITKTLQMLKPPHAAFAPACWWHCSTETDQFWSISINGQVNDRGALHAWFFLGVAAEWIDSCPGYSCSTGCPNIPQSDMDLIALN